MFLSIFIGNKYLATIVITCRKEIYWYLDYSWSVHFPMPSKVVELNGV
jgi:hypothetical protein